MVTDIAPHESKPGTSTGKSARSTELTSVQSERPARVWVLTNAPSPYQVELLSKVRSLTSVDLAVRFMRVPETTLPKVNDSLSGSYLELWGAAPRSWRDEFRLHPRALREAAFGKFDCYILSGLYTSVTFLLVAFLLTIRRKPWAIWLEQPRSAKYRLPFTRGNVVGRITAGLKAATMSFLLRNCRQVMGMGTAALNAYKALGADESKLSLLPYCCDVERFSRSDKQATRRIVEQHQLQNRIVFLYSGQMIERKGVDIVLRAFEKLAERRNDVALLLLGDGPLRMSYAASVPAALRDRVHFTGLLDQTELPAWFAAADVFVFASRHDGWAVVVNEACAAGLPILVSRQTGASLDLVEEGLNGFVLDCEDVDGFAKRMEMFCERPELIKTHGERSREIVSRFSTENGAERFDNCVRRMIQKA